MLLVNDLVRHVSLPLVDVSLHSFLPLSLGVLSYVQNINFLDPVSSPFPCQANILSLTLIIYGTIMYLATANQLTDTFVLLL